MGLKLKANTTMEVGRIQLLLMMLGVGLVAFAAGHWSTHPDALNIAWLVAGLACLVVPVERADRPLSKDTAAVSPVIAVILMVAITVVLAATVFVLVSDIAPKQSNVSPQIAWREDQSADTLTVLQAPTGLNWSSFAVSGCTGLPSGTVDAGDTITGCTGAVTVRHNPSNSLVYSGRFD